MKDAIVRMLKGQKCNVLKAYNLHMYWKNLKKNDDGIIETLKSKLKINLVLNHVLLALFAY